MEERRENFIIVDERDWEGFDENKRSWMLFKTMRELSERVGKLERKSMFHKACAALGGIIGGATAAFGIKWWS